MGCIDGVVCVSGIPPTVLWVIPLLSLGVILGLGYRLYQDRTILLDGGAEFSISTWWRWRRGTLRRMYRQFKSALLVGKISSHTFLIKSLIALGLIAALVISMRKSSSPSSPTGLDQQILVAATVFYATMIYFEGRFEYAALRPEDVNVTLFKEEEAMPTTNTSLVVSNSGEVTATNITAEMKIIDLVRNTSTFTHVAYTHPAADTDAEASDPLESGRRREITFLFNSPKNEFERTKMEDEYGIDPWVQIEIDSPDQRTSTWVYRSLKDVDPVDVERVVEGAKAMAGLYRVQRDKVLDDENAGIVGFEEVKDDDEDVPPRGIR
ncbi:hypothetical protein [Halobacterium salinarum]|uniref:hypothetical protein n=1 Tax=Halobacterium salinarum TaxID=2242 RepID=UPI0025536497|nr:hypothetical protein [Halobacterium salinarum]MDL0123660.1 hypothetical protein [Halobacterium salinarum]